MVPEEPFVDVHPRAGRPTGSPRPATTAGRRRWACRASELPTWDDIQFVTAQLAAPPAARRRAGRHRGVHRPQRRQAAVARHPDLRVRHELRRAVAGGQDRAGPRAPSSPAPASARARAACCPRSRPRTAATSTSWRRPASAGTFDVLTKVQAFHFKGGQGAKTGTGGHLPGDKVVGHASPRCAACPRARRRSRRRASPTGTRSTTSAASPTRCASASGGIPIGFKLSAQHIEDDIDAALDGRRRLRDPRRPRRRHRRRAAAVPRPHLGADDPGAGPGPRPPRPASVAATSPSSSPAGCATRPTSPRRWRSAPTPWRSPTRRSRPSAASACGPATPTTARSASPPRSRTCGPGCRSTRPPHRLDRFLRATVELMQVLARACGHRHLRRVRARRPHHLRPRHGRPHRHRLRRRRRLTPRSRHR